MKKVAWVTPDCFVDCDVVLMPEILKFYNICWFIVLPDNSRYKDSDFDSIRREYSNLTVVFVYERWRLRNPMSVITYLNLVKRIKQINFDAVYLNISVSPWSLAMIPFVKSRNTVVTAHQGIVHEGMGHKSLISFSRKVWYGHFRNVNMFSRSQARLFKEHFPSSKVYQFVLGLKDFGRPTNQRPTSGDVRFLSFGTLNYAKNIDLLIDAACLLYKRGVRGFKVSINGTCKDWSWYNKKIKYPEVFELDIRMIENSEIPNLFNGAHYLVQPYRVVSQSGPTKIAYNYNLPVVVSDLPGFIDELKENVNGYSFECGNAESLAKKMQWLIENHDIIYPTLLEKMKDYTKEYYSIKALVEKYVEMFDEII